MAFVNGVDGTGNINITVFPNKYDLIKWIYLNEVILKIENDDDWTEKYKEIFKYFIENKHMV